MEVPTTILVGGPCRGDEFDDPSSRDRFQPGAPWRCDFESEEVFADGSTITYACTRIHERVGISRAQVCGGVCLRKLMQEDPDNWQARLAGPIDGTPAVRMPAVTDLVKTI